jgi:dynein heavy chain
MYDVLRKLDDLEIFFKKLEVTASKYNEY